MEPLSVGMTDMVAGAGGAGFAMPRIRLNAGVSANTQTPESRAATMEGMLGGLDDSNLVLDPISELRDEFDNGVANLYSWVAESIQQGIDPRYYDPSNPESPKRYRAFIEEKQRLRRMRDDLVTTRELQKKDDFLLPSSYKGAEDLIRNRIGVDLKVVAKEFNKNVTPSGYDQGLSFNQAMQQYDQVQAQLFDQFQRVMSTIKDDEKLKQDWTNEYLAARAMVNKPNIKTMSELERASLDLRQAEYDLRLREFNSKEADKISIMIDEDEFVMPTLLGQESTLASVPMKPIKQPSFIIPTVEYNSAITAYVPDSKGGGKKESIGGLRIDGVKVMPIDKNGNPIVGTPTEIPHGFKAFATGISPAIGREPSRPVFVEVSVLGNKLKGEDRNKVNEYVSFMEAYSKAATNQVRQIKSNQSATPTATAPAPTATPASGGFGAGIQVTAQDSANVTRWNKK